MSKNPPAIIIETSARHIHISKDDFEAIFGKGTKLTKFRQLSQPHIYAANEVIVLKTNKDELRDVRILGPFREKTQIEISKTDAYCLGIPALVRESGNLEDTPGLTIVGPKGKIKIRNGVILAHRHIHASPSDAKKHKVKHKQLVSVKSNGPRSVTFHNVLIRVDKTFSWRMQIDTDEANAAGVDEEHNMGEVIIT
ncbi:MAG: phosphate propanoyltransferase [Patescibacteria group bacterium]|nr:phosphate propanoyltransferase [Patescibacteria group bacterium]